MTMMSSITSLLSRYGATGSTLLPVSCDRFGEPIQEARHARQSAVFFDLSPLRTIELSGADARKALHGQVTNDILVLGPGDGCLAAHLTRKGTMLATMVVRVDADDCVTLLVDQPAAEILTQRLRPVMLLADVAMRDRSDDVTHFLVAGPAASAVLRELTTAEFDLSPFASTTQTMSGSNVRLSGFAGLSTPAILVEAGVADADAAARALLENTEVIPAGGSAYDILRVEAGTPLWGNDIDEKNLPPECNIAHAISYTKGCYVGQETVARLRTYGRVTKALVGFVSGATVLPAGTRLHGDDREDVAWVTSSIPESTDGRPLALGFAKRDYLDPGTSLEANVEGRDVDVTVTALPFVDGDLPA